MKLCLKCNEIKPITEFYKHKGMVSGHLSFCKECVKRRIAQHRITNIDRIREYDRYRSHFKQRREQNKNCGFKYRDKKYFGGNAVSVLKRDNYKCALCNSSDRIIIHHKDMTGKKSKKRNNDIDMLITLCIRCHTKIHSRTRFKNGYRPPINKRGADGRFISAKKTF